MCEFLKTYQTLIVGFVGFLGVILTMLWNAYLQREQEGRRERQVPVAGRFAPHTISQPSSRGLLFIVFIGTSRMGRTGRAGPADYLVTPRIGGGLL
jgi:hypothetical protein